MSQFQLHPFCFLLSKLVFVDFSCNKLQAPASRLYLSRCLVTISGSTTLKEIPLCLFDFSFSSWFLCFANIPRPFGEKSQLPVITQYPDPQFQLRIFILQPQFWVPTTQWGPGHLSPSLFEQFPKGFSFFHQAVLQWGTFYTTQSILEMPPLLYLSARKAY